MTLEEARDLMAVDRGASRIDLNRAFQRKARHLHPDMHPGADVETRRRLAVGFDQLRQARDILLLLADRPPADTSTGTSHRRTDSTRRAEPTAPAAPSDPPSPGRAGRVPPAGTARTTLRFEQFVERQDAEGFGPGIRSRPTVDLARIVAWSLTGAALLATGAALAYAAFLV